MKSKLFRTSSLRFLNLGTTSIFIVLSASSLQAANFTWDTVSGDGTSITPGNGTWDAVTPNWNNAGANVAWSGNNSAVFGGSDGTYAITLAGDFTSSAAGLLQFVNSGYTLSASSAQSLTSSYGSVSINTAPTATNSIIWVAAGKEATIGNNVTVNFTGGSFGQKIGMGGTGSILNIASGAKLDKTTGANREMVFTGQGTINIAGTVTRSVASDTAAILIGHEAADVITMNVNSGGVISTASAGTSNSFGSVLVGGNEAGTQGTLNINSGGTVSIANNGTLSGLKLAHNATATGTVNLNGGILTTPRVYKGSGSGTFNFDGGTLKANVTNNIDFMTGLTAANVKAGGAKIDSNGFDVTIAQNLLHDSGLGASPDGGLIKSGNGTLTLSGAGNTYTGGTVINGGTLNLPVTLGSNITVNNGGTLAGTGSTTGSLTTNAGSSLLVNTVTEFTANTVNIAGSTSVLFNGALTSGIDYDVVSYGGGGFSGLGNLLATSRGTFTDDTISKIYFTAGSVGTRTLNNTSGVLDINGATNWVEGDKKFFNGDTVILDDTPGADSTLTVAATVVPAALNVSGNTHHTITGAGSIIGTGSITKSGSGNLTINNTNGYSGGTTINGGKIIVASDSALGTGAMTLGAGTLRTTASISTSRTFNVGDSSSTIEVDTGTTYSVSGAISGTGTLNKTGDGALTLTGNSTGFGGGANIQAGTLNMTGTLGATGSTSTIQIGAGTTVNYSGGTSSNTITGSGDIKNISGTLLFEGNHSGFSGTFEQNSSGNTQFNTSLSGSANASYTLTNGDLIMAGATGGPADYTVQFGALSSAAGKTIRGANSSPSGSGTVTLEVGALGTDSTIAGSVSNGGAKVIALTKVGAGSLALGGSNSFTGGVTVSAGTLYINGALSSAANAVAVNAGTLGGTGTIAGSVNVTSGASLSPGASVESLRTGALTIGSGATFIYEATDASSTGADLVAVNGSLTLTGVTLDLAGADLDALTWLNGDKLTLISYTGAGVNSGFTGFADDTTYFFGSNEWLFNYDDTVAGNNFAADSATGTSFVTMTLIPEPGSALLGGLGTLLLLRRRQR